MDIIATDKLAVLETIDFGCNWVEGSCAGMRKRKERGLKQIGLICCRQCAHNVGFLGTEKENLPAEYLQYWDNDKGFLDASTGCKLPRNMRSTKCSVYVCRDADIAPQDREIVLQYEQEYV